MIKFSKLNNKGFMLVEVVITSSVIAATLVGLFITLNKVSSSYEKRNRYYDLDAQQLAIEFNEFAKREEIIKKDDIKNKMIYDYVLQDKIEKYEVSFGPLLTNLNRYCRIYTASYNKDSISNLVDSNSTESFKDYIKYLKNSFDSNTVYSYVVIVEMWNKEDKNDYYYYALKVK